MAKRPKARAADDLLLGSSAAAMLVLAVAVWFAVAGALGPGGAAHLAAVVALAGGTALVLASARQLAARRRAARTAEAISRALPDLLFELDAAGRYVGYRADNAGDLAVPPEHFLGKRSAEVLPAAVAQRLEGAFAQVRTAGGVATLEYTLDTVGGRAQVFEGRVTRIETGGYLCIVRNITERKAAEAELLRHRDNLAELVAEQTVDLMLAKEAAERASRGQADFLAALSHDLRAPLHAILGFAEMGRAPGASEARRLHCLERVEQSGQRLLSMVSELHEVGRAEATRGPMLLAPVDWATLCRDVVAACEGLLCAKRLSADLQFDAGLCPVRADGPRLQQVVTNLVTNAIKFSPAGRRIVLRLTGCGGHEPERIRLEVEDQGVGLPEGGGEGLFEAFARGADATEEASPGSGLGLSICRQYVEAFGGSIGAREVPGGGALFHVELPCATVAAEARVSE